MANYCILCGEEIPEHKKVCGVCSAVYESLPPERAKMLSKVIEDEEARKKLRAGLQEIKLQIMIALGPVVECICDFIDTVLAMTEVADDGQ